MYVTVEQEVMNTQILLFANSCFARCDLYTSLVPVQVHECVIRIGTNTTCHRKNSYMVKQLGRNLSLFVCFFYFKPAFIYLTSANVASRV